jgi:4-amino-4-deoxy-L-arabinose transferase-like glycosyltransferase
LPVSELDPEARMEQASIAAGSRHIGLAWIPMLVSVVLALGLGALFWVGYTGTDDGTYVDAALGWLRHAPYVGDSHWAVRYPVVLTAAAGMALLGERTLAVGLPFLLALLGTALITVRLMARRLGVAEASAFACLFLTMPGSLVLATLASADVMELFLVVASLAFYLAAEDAGRQRWALLLGAGLCAGLAVLVRETTAALVLAYGVLFLIRPAVPRRQFALIGAGLCLVVLAEILVQGIATGDPLYRWQLDSTHDVVNRAVQAARTAAAGHVIDKEGNLSLGGPFLDTLLMFLVSQKYGLAFYLGALGSVQVLRSRGVRGAARSLLVAVLVLGVCWCAFVVANQNLLYLIPRYVLVGAWAACVLGGALLGHWWSEGRRALAGALFLAALAANGACLLVENTDPIQASKAALAAAARAGGEPVWTDPLTARRGRFLREVEGLDGRLRAGPPPPGALFAYAPGNVAQCAASPECGNMAQPYTPHPGWVELGRDIPAPKLFGALLQRTGLPLPPQLWRKIVQPNAGVILYRTD